MVFRAVLILLCLYMTKAGCRPVEDEVKQGALNMTIDMTLGVIREALDNLNVQGLLPNISCASLNVTEQQINNVSSYRCHIQKLSKCIPESERLRLRDTLMTCSQYLQDMEQIHSGQVAHVTCSLPTFEQDHQSYMYAKCLLQLVDDRLRRSKNGTIPL